MCNNLFIKVLIYIYKVFIFYFFNIAANKPHLCDAVSTMSAMPLPGSDISYSIRHVEEGWHHLIKSDDTKRLKEIAVCNFDFLLAAVSLNYCT